MKTYTIHWTMVPTNFNTPRAATVEAENPKDARTLFHDAMLKSGVSNDKYTQYVIDDIIEYVKPEVKGSVLNIG